jgi:peptidoglycan hydrolase-like protein with peptidoglycan-binding domain
MSCKRSEIVKQAQEWVGLNESDGSHKKIIDIYNAITPLPVGYKLKYTDAWCAGTVSAAAQVCNATDIIPTECSCPRMITKAQGMGIWVENDAHIPEPGDIVMYDWDDSGNGDNKGGADHVGIVEKVVDNTMAVIEGNYSNSVKRRYLQVNGKYIRGYIVPKYDDGGAVADPAPAEPAPIEEYTLALFVKDVQKACGASVDGIAGPETLGKTVTLSASKNRKHAAVLAVQKRLHALGYTEVGEVDGIAGVKFTQAVKHFQKDHGCVADGEITKGNKTWRMLLGMM